jgi:hypothetical protein
MFCFACLALPLGDFDFCFVWCVRRYEASVSAAIDHVFFAEVVLVEKAVPYRRNTHKNSFCIFRFNWCRSR